MQHLKKPHLLLSIALSLALAVACGTASASRGTGRSSGFRPGGQFNFGDQLHRPFVRFRHIRQRCPHRGPAGPGNG